MSIQHSICELKQKMVRENIDPENGLGDELFLFASTLMPIINVDLLVMNCKGEFLLSWRDDVHCGTGWHVPGGCIRFRESIETCIQKTAQRELGYTVRFDPDVLHVFEIFLNEERKIEDQKERAHTITLVMSCYVDENYDVTKQQCIPGESGFLAWFSDLPENLLKVQQCYQSKWSIIKEKLKGRYYNVYLEK